MAIFMHTLISVAQALPGDESDAATQPAAAASNQMSFSDWQKGLRTQLNGGGNDSHYRNLMLIVILVMAIIGVLLYLRQRKKENGPPTSVAQLARELSRGIKFPLGTRLLLWWVARGARLPVAALLISAELYQKSVAAWAQQPTFGPIRQWGAGRLEILRLVLFDAPPAAPEAGRAVGP